MQFLLLVLINILMACFFYLILRLKLEKYASDYREKRLKREMDEIINEFNETAERNITILDNRIEIIKTLLNKSGKLNSIDISIADHPEAKSKNKKENFSKGKTSGDLNNELSSDQEKSGENFASETDVEISRDTKGFLSRLRESLKDSFQKNYKSLVHAAESAISTEGESRQNYKTENEKKSDAFRKEKVDIVIDYTDDDLNLLRESENDQLYPLSKNEYKTALHTDQIEEYPLSEKEQFSEDELGYMFSSSEDKYLLISELYQKGYPADIISRSSGIPIGEIKLVVDLNKSL
ncbi:MAG: hypothetical protein JW864_13075 [Spirochaetes bacterium]|nr:hypothetical protein [Spirochaetota bacterium]